MEAILFAPSAVLHILEFSPLLLTVVVWSGLEDGIEYALVQEPKKFSFVRHTQPLDKCSKGRVTALSHLVLAGERTISRS